MDGEVIKSFLVGLGFDIDEQGLAKFYKAIQSATVRISALYSAIQVASAGIFYSISKMSEGFEEVGYQLRLVAPAINKFLILRQAMLSAYKAAGINLTQAVQQSILFNYSLAKTKFALEAIYKSVGIKFIPLLTKQMDEFRQKLFTNMPRIQEVLGGLVKYLFKAFEITIQFGSRVWDVLGRVWEALKNLDAATDGWSTKILLFVVAWKYLNLSFLATPFGMVIAGITALIALYDDFKVWQEGGESLINWGSDTTKMILGMITAVGGLALAITGIVAAFRLLGAALKIITVLQYAWDIAMAANPIGLIIIGVTALIGLLGFLAVKFGVFKSIGDWFSGVGGRVISALSSSGAAGQVASALGGANANSVSQIVDPQPLFNPAANSTQNVSQKTDIFVQGSSNAQETGKAVASQQDKVNFDLTRNLRSAAK